MKNLLVIFLLIATNAFADMSAWVSENGMSPPVKAYIEKDQCEAQGQGACYDVSKCSLDECSVQVVSEDDLSKPQYAAKSKVASCADKKDCQSKIAPVCDVEGTCVNYCADDLKPFISKDYKEVYCSKFLGYAKHDVKKLLADSLKKAAKDQAKSDADKKKNDRKKLEADLKKALQDWATLDAAAKDAAMKGLLKAYLKE